MDISPVFLARLIMMFALSLLAATEVESHGIVSATGDVWPDGEVFYRFSFTDAESAAFRTAITTAMAAVAAGTGNCINFTLVTNVGTHNKPLLTISLAPADATAPAMCTTNLGYQPNGQQAASMRVFSGAATGNWAGACLDDQRDIMRLLMNAVGLRNEWRHKKRDQNMVFRSGFNDRMAQSLRSLNIFNVGMLYPDDQVTDLATEEPAMDLNSITMVSGERFAENLNEPVFTLKGNGQVGTRNRLSVSDCRTVQNLYNTWSSCQETMIDCPDGYADEEGPTFYPSATINRAIQCQNAGRITLTELLLKGVLYRPNAPASERPNTAVIVPATAISGLALTLTRRAPIIFATTAVLPASDCSSANDDACQYGVKFDLTPAFDIDGAGGVNNRKVTVNILATGNRILHTLTLTLTLNCAPVFRKITALAGPHSVLAAEREFRFGVDIVSLPPPPALQTPLISAANKELLAAHIVNYHTPNGIGQATPGADPETQDEAPLKVFVNCNRDLPTGAGGGLHVGGTTVIGVVQAIDPEGDDVSYYAYSGDFRTSPIPVNLNQANGGMSSAAELHTVSKDGVIAISGVAELLGLADAAAANGNAGLAANSALIAAGQPRDVYIVAVDSRGASSVLRARFFLACGINVNA